MWFVTLGWDLDDGMWSKGVGWLGLWGSEGIRLWERLSLVKGGIGKTCTFLCVLSLFVVATPTRR